MRPFARLLWPLLKVVKLELQTCTGDCEDNSCRLNGWRCQRRCIQLAYLLRLRYVGPSVLLKSQVAARFTNVLVRSRPVVNYNLIPAVVGDRGTSVLKHRSRCVRRRGPLTRSFVSHRRHLVEKTCYLIVRNCTSNVQQDAVGHGRLRPRCGHQANWTKHVRRLSVWPISSIMWKHDVILRAGGTLHTALPSEKDRATAM